MRIAKTLGHQCVVLTDAEAENLVEACALMVLAVESDPRVSMPPQMGAVLCELFEGLKVPDQEGSTPDLTSPSL
ncbi:MAG: hypothetical protein O2787_02945 [Cyanobacteria bacterium]|nr:hypothetical protein [Cyanobacteriota bacterium]